MKKINEGKFFIDLEKRQDNALLKIYHGLTKI
jgi:hypothetical protein